MFFISDHRMLMFGLLVISIFLVFAIVAGVIYFVWKVFGNRMQEGYEEERYLVNVPGYDDQRD